MEQKKIDRINELARKSRKVPLSLDEKEEQAALRREYIEGFRRSLVANLERIEILEPDGSRHKIVPKKEKEAQEESRTE